MKNKMKTVWKIIGLVVFIGLVLTITGLLLGASRTLYLDKTGVHISGSEISIVEELDLEEFNEIYVDVSFSDIEIIRSDTFGIELYGENFEWDWTLEDYVLRITDIGSPRIQISHFDFFQKQNNYVKIFLPDPDSLSPLGVVLKTGSGNIRLSDFTIISFQAYSAFGNVDIENIRAGGMKIELGSGNFTGSNLEVFNLIYTNNFGDGHFQSVTATRISAESNSGDLHFSQCDFSMDWEGNEVEPGVAGMYITSGFGDINASDLITSEINIEAGSGNVNIAGDVSGKTVIDNNFGNIKLTTSRAISEYSYDISVKFGKIVFNGERLGDQSRIMSSSMLDNHINITSSSGDVEVNFGS